MKWFEWIDFTNGMPRILICFKPFSLDAELAGLVFFFIGVVPVGFSCGTPCCSFCSLTLRFFVLSFSAF